MHRDAAATLLRDGWLSERLGVASWQLRLPSEDLDIASALHGAVGARSFVYAKVPTAHLRQVHALEDAGFRVVDTAVQLRRDHAEQLPAGGEGVSFAAPEDEAAVVDVARRAFTLSRFHLDPSIDAAVADELKASWARSWFRGERGDAMVVGRERGSARGFLQLLTRGPALVIDLVGVAEGHRGSGLGARMIGFAVAELRPQIVEVGTQVANHGSVRFYERLGFRVFGTSYVLHRHGGPDEDR